ncbi:MAG: hypothetical protein RMN51_00790 [Verrucomicrobiota bacterium]|nr:hypothetical protein [Limisphaera sp.]MDW8380637.1 hypothetical protein [Verrucomicrobiota bacterium]
MTPGSPASWSTPALALLIQGGSALGWSLPVILVVSVHTTRAEWSWSYGMWPLVVTAGWLWIGVYRFTAALSLNAGVRAHGTLARCLAAGVWGLSPFLYWHARVPHHPWFEVMIVAAGLAGVALLYELNRLLPAVTHSLASESRSWETLQLCTWNRVWLGTGIILFLLLEIGQPLGRMAPLLDRWLIRCEQFLAPMWILFLVVPMALTVTLLWSTKRCAWQELLRRATVR